VKGLIPNEKDAAEFVSLCSTYMSLRTAEQIQRRYEQIADADEAYIHCMEGYVPNYRHEVEVNGGVFGADPLDNTPHPSLEGCRSQREYRNELAGEVGLPPI
jgi:hypothetical protein